MATRRLTLNFAGVVSLATRSESAIERKASFVNLCTGQPGHDTHEAAPVKAPKTCESCGPILDYATLVKGAKEGSAYAVITAEQVAEARSFAGAYKGSINLVPHPAAEFYAATAPGEKVNYLTPDSEAVAGQYRTLARFIEAHPELAFVGLYTPLSATGLYVVGAQGGTLTMSERVRSQSLRPVPVTAGEPITMLSTFLETTLDPANEVVVPYAPDAYEDAYAASITKLLATAERVTRAAGESAAVVGVSDTDLIARLHELKEAS